MSPSPEAANTGSSWGLGPEADPARPLPVHGGGLATVLVCDLVGLCSRLSLRPAVTLMVFGEVVRWPEGWAPWADSGYVVGILSAPSREACRPGPGEGGQRRGGFRPQQVAWHLQWEKRPTCRGRSWAGTGVGWGRPPLMGSLPGVLRAGGGSRSESAGGLLCFPSAHWVFTTSVLSCPLEGVWEVLWDPGVLLSLAPPWGSMGGRAGGEAEPTPAPLRGQPGGPVLSWHTLASSPPPGDKPGRGGEGGGREAPSWVHSGPVSMATPGWPQSRWARCLPEAQ